MGDVASLFNLINDSSGARDFARRRAGKNVCTEFLHFCVRRQANDADGIAGHVPLSFTAYTSTCAFVCVCVCALAYRFRGLCWSSAFRYLLRQLPAWLIGRVCLSKRWPLRTAEWTERHTWKHQLHQLHPEVGGSGLGNHYLPRWREGTPVYTYLLVQFNRINVQNHEYNRYVFLYLDKHPLREPGEGLKVE